MTDLLPLVLAGHFLGDWVVQTDWQAANKVRPARLVSEALRIPYYERSYADSWRAMAQHMIGYHLLLAAALATARWPGWHRGIGWRSFAILAGSLISHAIIDRRWTVRWLMDHTGSAAFARTSWGVMAVDQALHLSILCLLVAAVGR